MLGRYAFGEGGGNEGKVDTFVLTVRISANSIHSHQKESSEPYEMLTNLSLSPEGVLHQFSTVIDGSTRSSYEA